MARRTKPTRICLQGDASSTLLFCPYCGVVILDGSDDECGECPHLVYAGRDEDVDESGVQFKSDDLCFVFTEFRLGGTCENFVVFREANIRSG